MIIRRTRPEEGQRVNEIFSIAFDIPCSNCPADPENDRVFHYGAFEDDDRTMMGHLTINIYDMHFDGSACLMGGVGGVATLPQYRRRGGIRGCFEHMLPDLYRMGYDFASLYPFSTAYYRRFGFETCIQKLKWTVDLPLWNREAPEGSWVLAEQANPMTGAIRHLDGLWERRYNMMVLHRPQDYGWTEKFQPAKNQEYTYVCFDAAGVPRGYTTFRPEETPEGRSIACSRFCFDGKEGFGLLMGLFRTMASDFRYARFQTPLERGLQYYAREWSLGAARWELHANSGMVRVVNVAKVLKKARYQGSGRAVLKITDPQIPENDGAWQVIFREGRAESVEKTQLAPDALLTIPAFSALICGALDFEEARYALEGLEVIHPEPLGRVFYPKPLMITDYF